MPWNSGRADGATIAAPPYAASTCIHTPRSWHTVATPSRSSTTPVLVAPPVAIAANTSTSALAMASASRSPVRRPRSSASTSTTGTSMTLAASRIDEWALGAHATPATRLRPRRSRQVSRATVIAVRLPAVPPLTNTPPAVSGRPARPASQRSAWFSAWIAPAPSIHQSP